MKDETLNIVNSIIHAKKLYRDLIKLSHPDRNPEKKDLAEKFTALINENRYNHDQLLEIKAKIIEEFN